MKTYAAFYDNEIRTASSSGGIFSVLADEFDVIYGVAMAKDCYDCEFVRIEGDISPLRGSKYFQAKVGDTFHKVKQDLIAGKNVLFSGTGCQINGLNSFIQKKYPNLVTVDVICHGVPSPKLWVEYVKYQESYYGKIESVNFRCKDNSWVDYGVKENQIYSSKDTNPFMQMFLRNYCLRPSCYECHAKYYKTADLTIADFWGIENISTEMNDGKGTSLVITRTDTGQTLFDKIKVYLNWKEVSYEEGVKWNPSEYSSVHRPKERDTFYEDLNSLNFKNIINKYVNGPLWKRVGRKVKRVVKKFCK